MMSRTNQAWIKAADAVLSYGSVVSPRGMPVKELLCQTTVTPLSHPVLTVAGRKLNYDFMLEEARWILSGSNLLAPLTKYVKRMAQFSDDGETLAGAYGPRVVSQLDYVVEKLREDRDTRQAVMTLWTPNPQPSKDIPCTVAIDFKIREDCLHVQVFMRSSDVWLGLPYDIFSFSMIGCAVCERLGLQLDLGRLYVTAASSHLYERDWEHAAACLQETVPLEGPPVPRGFYHRAHRMAADHGLRDRLETAKTRPWWTL